MKYVLSIVAVLIVAFGGAYVGTNKVESPTLGNLAFGPNRATTTDSTWNGQALIVGGTKLLRSGSGVFSGVCIYNETAGSLTFYDATSTSHGDHATTTIFRVPASLAEGCYLPHISFSRGLLAEFQSSNVASTTVLFQ